MAPRAGVSTTTGAAAPTFSAKSIGGEELDLSTDFKGQLVLLDFWATWCGPCRGEIPHLVKAHQQYQDDGLRIIGITLDGVQRISAERVRQFAKENGMTWPMLYAEAMQIASQYGVQGIPAAFLVDGDTGKIIASGDALRGHSLLRTIEKHLKQKS